MLTRRDFTLMASLGLAFRVEAQAFEDDTIADVIPPLPSALRNYANFPPRNLEALTRDQETGTGEPSREQRRIASAILAGAPRATTPYQVAKYFHAIAKGARESEWQGYMRAWPSVAPANPVVTDFFTETRTVPSGDTTAWCAAFMNWCISRAYSGRPDLQRLFPPTRSASSGSFRNWGRQIQLTDEYSWSSNPRPGDIVVFAQMLSSGNLHPTKGHVAFFVKQDNRRIHVLGGNQFEGAPPVHCINQKGLRLYTKRDGFARKRELQLSGRNNTVLVVHSVRTARSLHEEVLA